MSHLPVGAVTNEEEALLRGGCSDYGQRGSCSSETDDCRSSPEIITVMMA